MYAFVINASGQLLCRITYLCWDVPKHARDLGFTIQAIESLIQLQESPEKSCKEATDIANEQLLDVRRRIKQLRSLEKELARIVKGCSGEGTSQSCYVLAALADHELCEKDH